MDLLTLARVFIAGKRIAGRDYWSRERLEAHQNRELSSLRNHAYQSSPF